MKPLAAALLLLGADSSWRSEGAVDLSKIVLVKSFGPWRSSTASPAGDSFAVYDGNNVTLVDVRKERESHSLTGHSAHIHDSGWSRDGRTLATSGYDGTVRVWEVATGRQLASVAAHSGFA